LSAVENLLRPEPMRQTAIAWSLQRSKRTRNWALSQPERLKARDKLALRFPEGPQTIHQVAGHARQIEKIRSSAWHREAAAHVDAWESNARERAVFRWAAQFA
jgi:hypothetical protein